MLELALYIMFRTLARRRWSRAAAWLFLLSCRRLRTNSFPLPVGERRLCALILAKDSFSEDIEASLGASREFEIVSAQRGVMKGLAAGILSRKIDDNGYLTDDPEAEESKIAYREFLRTMWRHVGRIKPFDVVMSGNFGYYAEREFATALEDEGTPFIVSHKENLKSPVGSLSFAPCIRNGAGVSLAAAFSSTTGSSVTCKLLAASRTLTRSSSRACQDSTAYIIGGRPIRGNRSAENP